MNELANRDEFTSAISHLEKMDRFVEMCMKNPHYKKMGATDEERKGAIFALSCMALTLKMDPMAALNGELYYLKGKVGMAADTMAKLIRMKGHSITKDPTSSNELCILHGRRRDTGDTWTVSYSIDDAKRACIYKDNWQKMPGIMCYKRAMSQLARELFPDCMHGAAYEYDELQQIASSISVEPVDVQEAEIKNEEITPIVEKISEDQASHVETIFKEYPHLKERIMSVARKHPYNVQSVAELPKSWYGHITKLLEEERVKEFNAKESL